MTYDYKNDHDTFLANWDPRRVRNELESFLSEFMNGFDVEGMIDYMFDNSYPSIDDMPEDEFIAMLHEFDEGVSDDSTPIQWHIEAPSIDWVLK